MMGHHLDFNACKRDINLIDFLVSEVGFAIAERGRGERGQSTRMRGPDGDILIVRRDVDGHWVYFSAGDPDGRDSGTIFDFLRNHRNASWQEVGDTLRPWLQDAPPVATRIVSTKSARGAPEADFSEAREQFLRAEVVSRHPYLTARGLPDDILQSPPFAGTVRMDKKWRNAFFAHENDEGLCGYEIKNRDFTGFSSGGVKALWRSSPVEAPQCLVIAESAIDAMSHWAIHRPPEARYVSTGGAWGPRTNQLLLREAVKMPLSGKLLLAFDHDEAGLKYLQYFLEFFDSVNRSVVPNLPPQQGWDWNDVLRNDSSR